MIMELYVAESTLLRVEKLENTQGADAVSLKKDILNVNIYDAAGKIRKAGLDAICSFAEGKELEDLTNVINDLTKVAGVNVKDARRKIADKMIDDTKYRF